MSRKIKTLNVTIMEKEYPVACPPGQEATLMSAVDQVDKLMHTIKRNGRTVGIERIAVMAALNTTHELLTLKEKLKSPEGTHASETNAPQAQSAGKASQASSQPENQTSEEDSAKLKVIAEEEAAIAKQLQALTEKIESTLKPDTTSQPAQSTEAKTTEPAETEPNIISQKPGTTDANKIEHSTNSKSEASPEIADRLQTSTAADDTDPEQTTKNSATISTSTVAHED
jgi:cell division protein ZapA